MKKLILNMLLYTTVVLILISPIVSYATTFDTIKKNMGSSLSMPHYILGQLKL